VRPSLNARIGAIAGSMALLVAGGVWVVREWGSTPAAEFDGRDGRTWLAASGTSGSIAVLVNGISGLIEAQAPTPLGADADGLGFRGSHASATLLGNEDRTVLIRDGSHEVVSINDRSGLSALAADGGAVVVGEDEVLFHPIDSPDSPLAVQVEGTPMVAAPVQDADGNVWVLIDRAGRPTAVRIDRNGSVGTSVDVDEGVRALTTIDGAVASVGDEFTAVDGARRWPAPSGGGRSPTVASGTGGQWALSDGRNLSWFRGGDEVRYRADGTVDSLALWHGTLWVVSGGRLIELDEDGSGSAVGTPRGGALPGSVRIFEDGGRLWLVSSDRAMSIGRDQQITEFQLAAVSTSLDLCLDTCSPDDARQQTDLAPTTTLDPSSADSIPAGEPTTTTEPTVELSLPPVVPTFVTTTTTTAPSTGKPGDGTSTSTAAPQGDNEADDSIAVAVEPTDSVSALPEPTAQPVPLTDAPPPAETLPPVTEPPVTRPPTTEVPSAGNLRLYFVDESDPLAPGTVQVGVGFAGSRRSCPTRYERRYADAYISWDGPQASGLLITVDLDGSDLVHAVPAAPDAVTVSLSLCGLTTSITRSVLRIEPTIGQLSLVDQGGAITAQLPVSVPSGWSSSVSWFVGTCGQEQQFAGVVDNGQATIGFAAVEPGRYCARAVVSFVASDGGTAEKEASGAVEVIDAASTVPETTLSDTTTTTLDDGEPDTVPVDTTTTTTTLPPETTLPTG
jgi:hypothetical protein